MTKRNKKILGIIVTVFVTLFFIFPVVGFGILKWAVLPPEKLTPLVIEEANKFIEAHLECEKVELTYFETYPHLGIRLTNGRLISHQAEDSTAHEEELHIPSDSLLCFSQAIVSLRPTDYLFSGKITIGEITIDRPRIYGYVNKEGRANWDIYKSEPDSTNDTDQKPLPPVDLQKVRISGGHFTYNDHQQDVYAEVNGFSLRLDGSLASGHNTLDIETEIASVLFRSPAYTLSNNLAVGFKSRLLLRDNYTSVALEGAQLNINKLPFTANGAVSLLPDSKRLKIDLDMGLKVSDMNDLLHFIPKAYFQDREKIEATGSILLEGNVHGELGDSIVPNVNLCCRIENGSYHIKGIKQGIDTLQMDMDVHMNGLYPDSSFVSLETLTMKGLNTSVEMNGRVTNLMKNPAVDAKVKGKIDFTRLAEEFLNPDTLLLQGVIDADFSARFTLDDVLDSRYEKVEAGGKLNVDKFKVYSKSLDVDMYIAGGHLAVGSQKTESKYLNATELLNATLSVDTMNIKYKDEINTNVSRFEMQANTVPVIDTSAVIPLTGHMQFEYMRSRLPDSTWIVAGRTNVLGGIKGSASNKRVPTAGMTISVDTLKFFKIPLRTGAVLAGSIFNIEALPYREAMRQRRQQQQMRPRRNASGRARMALPQNIQVDTVSESSKLLRKWEAQGNVQFNKLRVFSRLFPIPIYMDKTNVKFSTNTVTLSEARLHLGKSNLLLNGEINQIRQAMLRGGKLKGNFSLVSDYIDCNQLMQALNVGMQYAEQQAGDADMSTALNEGELNTQTLQREIAKAPIDTADQLFVLPGYLDMKFYTNAKQIDFKDLKLEDVQGEVVLRDQSVNLNNLGMRSNIGRGNLTLIYEAKNKQGASAGFDLDMEDVLVDKLIGLYPSLDTMMPMLRSFEGVVDCQMTATCQIDSTMSVILPSVYSACHLHGENMVLLDGEAFAEISKTLMFKNKKRNVIDSISVNLAVKDNKIEIYPFMAEMDRYKVAVGGTHNLDMTFNYHISVLKSPVPFKLGIDVTGNLDDFKYKIVKCRYKDILQPARQEELNSTHTNIRNELQEMIRKQIKEAAPKLTSDLPLEHPHVNET